MDKVDEELKSALEEAAKAFENISIENQKSADSFWEGLSYEDKCNAFHAVVERIFDGDVNVGGTYRYVLYNKFGFDADMYVRGMDCGYMGVHNILFDGLELDRMRNVTRLEVIDDQGRSYTKYLTNEEHVKFSLQDDDRTLKVFIDTTTWKEGL